MKVNIKPVSGKLLIKIEKLGEETKSGIKLVKQGPEWQNETLLAEVMAKPDDNKEVEAGQVILIRGDAGRWIDPELVEDRDYTYRIIDKEEIIAVVEQVESPLQVVQ